ncbi:MAG: FAD-dependent oxidoreductase, partial [Pseudomonadota bacterium]
MTRSRAIIVGAGINGLCTAWALHKRGWAVTVLDEA